MKLNIIVHFIKFFTRCFSNISNKNKKEIIIIFKLKKKKNNVKVKVMYAIVFKKI